VEAVGRIRYDQAFTEAQINKQALVEYTEAGAATDINEVWSRVSDKLGQLSSSFAHFGPNLLFLKMRPPRHNVGRF